MELPELVRAWCEEHRKGWDVIIFKTFASDLKPIGDLDGTVASIYTTKVDFHHDVGKVETISAFDPEFFTILGRAMDSAEKYWTDKGWVLEPEPGWVPVRRWIWVAPVGSEMRGSYVRTRRLYG